MDELLQAAIVRTTAVVLVVTSQFRVEHLLLVCQWRMHMPSTPCGDGEQPAPQALLHRAHMHREFASPARGTPVRKVRIPTKLNSNSDDVDRVLKRGAWWSDSNVAVQHRVCVKRFSKHASLVVPVVGG